MKDTLSNLQNLLLFFHHTFTNFNLIDHSCLQPLLLSFAKWWFTTSNILSTFSNWNSTKKELSIYPTGRIIHYYLYFIVQIILDFAIRSLSSLLYFFNMSLFLFAHFLIFWHHKMFQLILNFAFPLALKSDNSPKNLIPFTGESSLEINIWALGMLITTGNHCF